MKGWGESIRPLFIPFSFVSTRLFFYNTWLSHKRWSVPFGTTVKWNRMIPLKSSPIYLDGRFRQAQHYRFRLVKHARERDSHWPDPFYTSVHVCCLFFHLSAQSYSTRWNKYQTIGSILNPLAGKFSEDTRKKGKGAKTGASHDWRSFCLSQYDWLKGSHMTKVLWLPNETDYSYCEFVAPNTPYSA